MPPKLTKEVINSRISSEGYTCLEYNFKVRKFNYLCPKGHKGSMRMDHWRKGVRCAMCAGNKKLSLDVIRDSFNKEGYTLLSKEYINSKTLLTTLCPKGHIHKTSWNNWSTGYSCSKCSYANRSGKNNTNYKGGVTKKGLVTYKTFVDRVPLIDNPTELIVEGASVLGVSCHYCHNTFAPTRIHIVARINSITGKTTGECNFYCSDECKHKCGTFRQVKFFKGQKQGNNKNYRVHQKEWANLIKERDEGTCLICGEKHGIMIAHHEIPVIVNEILSLDLDNGLTLCKKCHTHIVHKLPWCTNGYLSNCKSN